MSNSFFSKRATRLLAPPFLQRLRHDPDPFHRMLWSAVQLSRNQISPEEFRLELDRFYSSVDAKSLERNVGFEAIKKQLQQPGGYKNRISRFGSHEPGRWASRFSPWERRFGLLARLGINSDVLLLRKGDSVPPHGHRGVVSGFLVMEGQVRIRHFDCIEQRQAGLVVRPTIDTVLCCGQFTTNSEYHDDIHWLQGIAEESFLFRTNVIGLSQTRWKEVTASSERRYVDPTQEAGADGRVFAPFVTAQHARSLLMS